MKQSINTDENKAKLQDVFAKRKAKEKEKEAISQKNEVKDRTPFIERFGEEQLINWKLEHQNRDLIYLKVDDNLAVLRPPMAEDLGDYLTAIGMNGMSKAVAMIVEKLWLDGDYALIEDEDLFIAVFLQMNNILESKKGEFFRA
ncbi:hypothetical protein HX126_21110 [Chryseobacterium indologenes]|uniref:hypothetical protein n=1 Tax=Chryseobacterium TaxID=59732 RepID=UPI00162529DA|nr:MULTISPECIES: hypothetical protein [Chryseobacterium]MDM1557058.1 hypothetical protein [Chryseobacterium indologenes]